VVLFALVELPVLLVYALQKVVTEPLFPVDDSSSTDLEIAEIEAEGGEPARAYPSKNVAAAERHTGPPKVKVSRTVYG
jgi:hypothetical protein